MHHLISGKVLTYFFFRRTLKVLTTKVEVIFFLAVDQICIRRLASHVHLSTILQVGY